MNHKKNTWKKIAARFIKTKKSHETLEMALKRAHAFTMKNRRTRRLKK